jgi:hypothetical protein
MKGVTMDGEGNAGVRGDWHLNWDTSGKDTVYRRETKEFFSDEETINESGGKQSRTHYRLDLVDPFALLVLGRVLLRGVRYGEDNWRLIPAKDHVNHALGHIMGWLSGDKTDDHLANAFCRLMMAIAMEKPNGI